MNLITESYPQQACRWPRTGKHILAQYDGASIVVYQAYSPEIGRFAAQHGYFGGTFSLNRMSWIKPNFLWMMYRSGWATKEDQGVILAIRLKREGFEQILAQAVHSTFIPEVYGEPDQWWRALQQSCVRLQWDPDHDPAGQPLARRAIQLGLRGDTLAAYAQPWILEIQDITDFVCQQRLHAVPAAFDHLLTPREEVYHPADASVATHLQLGAWNADS